ncbi:Glycosyltransferase like family protein [Chryseobacterium sp. RU37D]|uniref:glycosyltransferase n=1 Tax=Chryseobacterium sp. RU37D TaxID=1907397 RepID=UPI00095401DB|nr:glycosyltransferase [Chryseobacterium sp. RU37D]SIQ04553.1 Glycosyltransferase like family protein [Chryseobacterium sp. RU37D]
MLSIIISSYLPDYFSALEKNIAETIGMPYEIIKIENPGLMGICEAYNKGAKQAKFNYLLFTHEDILFKSENWGQILTSHLDKENTGIIGLAGSSYVPSAPSSWTVSEKYNYINILQGNKKNTEYFPIKTTKENRNKVFAVDGVFLGIKKENYDQFTFNEALLKGFHGYDLDFSLRVSKKFQNYVIDDILIQHFSGGNLDKNWLDANIKVREHADSGFQKDTDPETEKKAFSGFLYNFFRYYPVNRKNILLTFRFYPKKLNFKGHLELAKKYYSYIRYARSINKKLDHK